MDEENLTIYKLFAQAVSKFPEKIALQIKKNNYWQRLTYEELDVQAKKVATFLAREGLKKGNLIVLILENLPEWAAIYLGIIRAGLVCVPLDYQLSSQEIQNLILDSNAKVIFCSYAIFSEKIHYDIRKLLDKIVIVGTEDKQKENCIAFSEIEKILPEESSLISSQAADVASLIYTSGTTGEPKGVLLSQRNICSNFMSLSKTNLCFPSDNFISLLPLHHTYPFMVTLILPLFLGATVTYLSSGFNPEDLTQTIKQTRTTILPAVPQLFSLLHSRISEKTKRILAFLRPLFLPFIRTGISRRFGTSLRIAVSGGARLEPKIARELTRFGFKIIEGYGLTETSPVVTLNPPDKVKFGSVGKAIPDVMIKIDEPDKNGIGEVTIKGPNVMLGYFKRAELSSSVIKDGWFYSGDLGYIDKDGYLFITGRKSDVIVLSSGKNIYPEELEEYYSQSPMIKEICILAKAEERFGRTSESLHAVVVPDLEYFRKINESNIRDRIRWELENLAKHRPSYMHIMGFTLIKEELPRTILKKIERYKVKEKHLSQGEEKYETKQMVYPAEDRKIFNTDIAQKIIGYLQSQQKKPVYLDSHLEIDLGIDSLTKVELGLGLETLLSTKIPDELFFASSTVKDIIIKILEIAEKTKPCALSETRQTQKTWSRILRELPDKRTLDKIRIDMRPVDWLLTWIFKTIFLFTFRICWFLKIEGEANLPDKGPYIICPNHASYLDGFVIFSSLPLKLAANSYFLGLSYILEYPLFKWSLKLARLIPININTNLNDALQAISFVLSHKKIVCIFPQGMRSIGEEIEQFKKGVGILIKEMDIPVVPVYIKGSHQSWPRGNRLPRFSPIKVVFGKPLSAHELLSKVKRELFSDDYEGIAQSLREAVMKLSG